VLQQVDTPKTLYHRPANVFVAGFIGSPAMNLFEGRLQGGNIVLPTASIPVPSTAFERIPALKAYEGQPLIFGIRPEGLYDSKLESGSRLATIPVKVSSIEELGSERIVHVSIDATRVDSGDPDAVEDLGGGANAVAKFEEASTVEAGEAINL